MEKKIRDYGIVIGRGQTGPLNKITDVKGVKVGHKTLDDQRHKTGVTVILPCDDNPFTNKLTAAAYIHNGFGKSLGLLQVEELGTIETPIALTNTLNVGKVHDALVEYMIEQNDKEGVTVFSTNPVVGECNDSILNDIRDRPIGPSEVREAIRHAEVNFQEGDVGAGKGTVCFGMKGGIGSASRVLTLDGQDYTLGVLVQTNFGKTENFCLNGKALGEMLKDRIQATALDRGSIMSVIATDLPVSDRQLKRIIKRAGVGLSRCGSFMGHGSGDIMIGFTTANRIPMGAESDILPIRIMKESRLEEVFTLMAEAEEEAILNSLAAAGTVQGFQGAVKYSLTDLYLSGKGEEG